MLADPSPQGSTATEASPVLQEGLTQFLEAKSKGDDSGNYRRNAKRVITRFIDWLDQRDIESFEQLDEIVLAHYAEHLRRRVAANEAETTDSGIARSTAWTHYNTISAFLGWVSKWGYLQENYARAGIAQESMPERSASQQSERQTNERRFSTTLINALTTLSTRRASMRTLKHEIALSSPFSRSQVYVHPISF